MEALLWLLVFGYLIAKRRKDALYAGFLVVFFVFILNILINGNFPLDLALSGALGVFYPILFVFSSYFLIKSLSVLSLASLLFGIGFGALAKESNKKVEIEYGEVKRKVFHLLSAVVLFLVPYLYGKVVGILFVLLAAIPALLLPRVPFLKKAVKEMYETRGERPAEGAFNAVLGAIVPIAVGQPWIVLALGFGDGISTLVGKFFGKVRIWKNKTLEGAISEFLAVLAISKYFYPSPLIPASIYTAVELFSPIDDNLLLPIALSLLYIV